MPHPVPLSRRDVLRRLASGFGHVALAGLCAEEARSAPQAAPADPLAPKKPHFRARAKRVVFLCMRGGPSHVDTFDYKPALEEDNGRDAPQGRGRGAKLLRSPWEFRPHGRSGLWISELFPEVARHADRLCLLRGMHTDIPAHPQAFLQMHTGSFQFVRPSLGAWTLYGLGSENRNLPGYLSIKPPSGNGGAQNYGSAFLPAVYQGTRLGQDRVPVENARLGNVANPVLTPAAQRTQLDLLQRLNAEARARDPHDPQVEGVIASYELAFRMQGDVPKVLDIAGESEATRARYGIGSEPSDDFGRQCLMARRCVEAGVRFVEVCGGDWDQHRNLRFDHARNAASVDRPIAGLLADLAERGLLEETLVVWAGEFGRTPSAQNGDGRDHNHKGYTIWMAGGGVKGGLSYGGTDPHGFEAVDGKVHIHDLHATLLHLLGLDHTRLTYRYAGRDFRLTDVRGEVVKAVLA